MNVVDDWDDGLLSGRPVALTVINGSLFAKGGGIINAKRPEWSVVSGNADVSTGVLRLWGTGTAGGVIESTDTNGISNGYFEVKFRNEVAVPQGSGNGYNFSYSPIRQDPTDNFYSVANRYDYNDIILTSRQSGSWVEYYHCFSCAFEDANWHTLTFRKTATSVELLIDGVSKYSGTTSFHPQANYMRILRGKASDIATAVEYIINYTE